MKISNSKSFELSVKDVLNIVFLALSFIGGFYFANMDLINAFIGDNISPEYVGITTAFVYYFFKQLIGDNSNK